MFEQIELPEPIKKMAYDRARMSAALKQIADFIDTNKSQSNAFFIRELVRFGLGEYDGVTDGKPNE